MSETFDNTQAFTEGWALFNDGDLQRLDEGPWRLVDGRYTQSGEPRFANDAEALAFVKHQANQGSAYHQAALRELASCLSPS